MAAICYVEGVPFKLFETNTFKTVLSSLHPAYKPPTRKAIAGPLLDESYEKLQLKVNKIIAELPLLNIVTDESTNINNARIINLSLHTSHGSFHYLSEDIGSTRLTAENTAEWLKKHMKEISESNWDRINSITTDTCSTQLSLWNKLQEMPELQHLFCIPCDSHGIQLLIKDILKISSCKLAHDQAQIVIKVHSLYLLFLIVKAFKNSPLQLSHLRAIQVQRYGKPRALCLSVITRWGTQFRLFQSLLRNKEALQQFTYIHNDVVLSQNAEQLINSTIFWAEIESMVELLEPIDTLLRMSESNDAHLGMVVSRWKSILGHLSQVKNNFFGLQDFLSPIEGAFRDRYQRQVLSIHIAAFYLSPINHLANLDFEHKAKVFEFFQ